MGLLVKSVCFLWIFMFVEYSGATLLTFPAGDKFTAVDPDTVADKHLYTDAKNTGSVLIDSQASSNTLDKRLGKNVPVSKFMAPGVRYVRAHPAFMDCLQKVIMALRHEDVQVTMLRGFITSAMADGSDADQYLQSGCGVELAVDGATGTLDDIAGQVFKQCPVVVERQSRDIEVIVQSDRVHFHMAGPGSSGHQLTDNRSPAVISSPLTWMQGKINDGLDPQGTVDCSHYSELTSGNHYPASYSHDRVVGLLDVPITRDMEEFKRLVQYQGTNIQFENSEGGAAWCGNETRTCPSVCATQLLGNDLDLRCADRMMSSRMLSVLHKLQKKVRLQMSDKLLVTEAWDEPYTGQLNGDAGADTLHYEGRAAKLSLVSGDTSRIAALSKYAVCSGADYVEHRGSYLYVGVKRYLAGGSKVLFPHMELLEVKPPIAQAHHYALPSLFTDKDARQYPLFDSAGKLDATLSANVTLGQFVAPDYRYFRLSPRILECYNDIVAQVNKRNKAGDSRTEIKVIRGYLSNNENKNKFDVINDKRYNTHNLGVAMQIKYENPTAEQTPYKLFLTAIDMCSPRFYQTRKEMGIGLYADSVYVGVRKSLVVMKETMNHLPADVTEDDIIDRYYLARGGKVVDPENLDSACQFANTPKPQSYDFVHEHSEVVKRKRRRRQAGEPAPCTPTRYTTFCSSTVKPRNDVIDDITSQLDRKHYPVKSRADIMTALHGCFGDCGTCLDGEVYDSKTEHCNNFLHWVDWTLINTSPDITNFFVRSNRAATKHACDGGQDCIENAPLFSLVAPSVEKVYRPDPTKSVENELYSMANNPLPVMPLLEDIYAIQASGVVKFWVKDDTEMTALKRPLEVVMLYNNNVTLVEIYVERYRIARDAVKNVVETSARTMATQGCPLVTRETLTPYEILEVPPAKKKRAAEPDSVRYQIRDYHKNYEARWANRHMLI